MLLAALPSGGVRSDYEAFNLYDRDAGARATSGGRYIAITLLAIRGGGKSIL
jgi:hypothetical protein